MCSISNDLEIFLTYNATKNIIKLDAFYMKNKDQGKHKLILILLLSDKFQVPPHLYV